MKAGAYFQSNPGPAPQGPYYAHQSKTYNPYNNNTIKPAFEFGQKNNFLQPGVHVNGPGNVTKVIHNGIRLVGLASSPNDQK
jgi:hypothetical protein